MGTKMKKGILRPFRYISNMMDGKEPEMQIGFPTDVKHVAHIGWDGPSAAAPTTNNNAAPTWMKDYHSAPLDSASFRSETGGAAASNPWASQEIVLDGGSSLGDTSFRDTRSEAGGIDGAGGDSPPSPGTRRSRRHRSRGSMDAAGAETTEKKEKGKKGIRKNRKKDKDKAGDDGGSNTCQDLPAVPKKSNRRKNKGSSEGNGAGAAKDTAEAAAEEGSAAALPPVAED
ncbi:hypothetical protein EJB05_53563 [Eragrostis curvula]|uniref:CRIB domain-containing protein n=1 Tax=Eragrostis curvula TaxID=38414 RepID=A0A5J9SPT9_9POAL|nr:hypothetical protein EJB05_53563 [Eragrostis curvula]